MSDERELVLAARQLLSVPERWTRSTTARRADGSETKPTADDACMWCVVGAVAHFAPGGIVPYNVLRLFDQKIGEFLPHLPAVTLNGFEWAHDRFFTYEVMLRFLDFVLESFG